MSGTELRFVDSEEVIPLVVSAEHREQSSIVDVRDADEYAYGHIVGATNLSSDKWNHSSFVDQVVHDNLDKKVVVFHCMLSQKRGPTCARIFSNRLQELNSTDRSVPEV